MKWKDNMIYVISINVKYVFYKTYQACKLFKDILYIPGGWDRERIALTDDLQLPSNHNRNFTWIILQGQNNNDIWYVLKIITFVVYNTKLKCYEVGLSYFWLTLVIQNRLYYLQMNIKATRKNVTNDFRINFCYVFVHAKTPLSMECQKM